MDEAKPIPFVHELPLLKEHWCLVYLKEDFPNIFRAKCSLFIGLNNWG